MNEGLADTPTDKLDYSLRQDVEQVGQAQGRRMWHSSQGECPLASPAPVQVLSAGKRIAGAMVKLFEHAGKASGEPQGCAARLTVLAGRRVASACVGDTYAARLPREPMPAETFNAMLLAKSLRQRMWTDSGTETRQLPGIGPLIAARLAAAGVRTLRDLAAVEPRRLESLAQRHFPFGERAGCPGRRTEPACCCCFLWRVAYP